MKSIINNTNKIDLNQWMIEFFEKEVYGNMSRS